MVTSSYDMICMTALISINKTVRWS